MNHRIFERTLRLGVFPKACLFERDVFSPIFAVALHSQNYSLHEKNLRFFFRFVVASNQVGLPAELKHINKRRKRNQQGLPQ